VSVDDDVSKLMTELTKCLGRLNDVKFVVECCINTGLPQLAATNQLLSLARERLQKWRGLSAELHASLDTQLHETTRRLAAFQVTHFHLYSQSHVPPFRLHTFIICTVSLMCRLPGYTLSSVQSVSCAAFQVTHFHHLYSQSHAL